MKMTHKQRIEKALEFDEIDRVPYSLWMHFPNRDRHPRRLAELSLANQKRYDLDFIKFMPYGMYSTIDFGMDIDVFEGFNVPPVGHAPIISKVEDCDNISYVPGTRGEYAIVLEAQRILFEMMDECIPFVQTVFSPMTTAAKMCGSPSKLMQFVSEDSFRVHHMLEIITETTMEFAKASVDGGADGLFFATQVSSADYMDIATHRTFVEKYDREILNSVKDRTWFNILHIHGKNIFLQEIQDYPVQALNWHDRDVGPSLNEVRTYSAKTLVGGLSWGSILLDKTNEEIVADIHEAASYNEGKGFILGPGCVIDPTTPEEKLDLIYDAILKTTR
ncbi:uroporphyrinogen decarboxylase family protein [Acetomicrobium sp.]|uniref:uroporphyrinogen decarboxylase family protein n=1 Tax=Acetomicrobium sp. TaxID=1872099 RepID=UPI001BCF4BF7|nr:uroporphyrinogen decarboxylase family protein [Acetomicrobium sp.]